MHNVLEYTDKHSMTLRNLWKYYRDEVNDDANENNSTGNYNNQTTTSKYFEYNTKIIGSTPENHSRLDVAIVLPSKYLNSFWRYLDLFYINCEIE